MVRRDDLGVVLGNGKCHFLIYYFVFLGEVLSENLVGCVVIWFL